MRINVYAEELTDRVEVISKTVDGVKFEGVRFYLYLPATTQNARGTNYTARGPFIHREGDDDSAAVTFWGKPGVSVRDMLTRAVAAIDAARAAQS